MQTNFLLGTLQLTTQVQAVLKRVPYDLVARHAINEHGLITDAERRQNAMSMLTIGPITSRYKADPTDPRSPHVVIKTDAVWGSTLISLE